MFQSFQSQYERLDIQVQHFERNINIHPTRLPKNLFFVVFITRRDAKLMSSGFSVIDLAIS